IKVSSAQVLQLNTLRKIADAAEVIYEQLWTREEYEEIREDYAARGEKIEKVLPITAGQDEMLFEQLINPDRGDFKKILFLDIDSAVSEKDLRESLDITTDENEAMRASIVYRHVTAIQQVITDRKIPLEIIDGEGFGSSKMQELKERLLYSPMDLQRDSLIRVVYQRAPGINMLCFLTHSIAFDAVQRRTFLARLMGLLEEKYPDDKSVSGWREIMEKGLSEAVREGSKNDSREKKAGIVREVPPDICVYSENAGPKVVFVHTGNTGSEAYYRLAGRIGDRVSFAVIEPFNIYHMDKACYGIKNIAAKYIEILKHYQPEGPYILGGWCYGGIVAHEMACQLESLGESVAYLILLDSHAHSDERTKKIIREMNRDVNRSYFETSPLFSELRESGMLEKMIVNAEHVREDILDHIPSVFHGNTLYFKPDTIPMSVSSVSKRYWEKMMEYEAGNYEHFCLKEKLKIVHTPQEHDLMMDDPSLDIIVPELMKTVISGQDL
ncbi:MAG: hypothetical protein IK111_06245, partial [Lachnospiraceae bacterium]|nr:hypothetical protein [Lachnospiraceae bacterium]